MKVLLVVHVGETLGHLVRAITIAHELERLNCEVECLAHERAEGIWIAARLRGRFHPVIWEWSHNQTAPSVVGPELGSRLVQSVCSVRHALERSHADHIVGVPGFASAQLAKALGTPHSSVIHGPHLAPMIQLKSPTLEETAVLALTSKVCLGALNDAFNLVSDELSLPAMTYQEFMEMENIFVAQPGLPFQRSANIALTSFIRGSIGKPWPDSTKNETDSVFVTFGTGNTCDFSRILRLASRVFVHVIASTGNSPVPEPIPGVELHPFIAFTDVAKHVRAVVSHGGIGTVGTFAEYGLPQLIIPTEIDQANMAMHAGRSGLARSLGLRSFVNRATLGRNLPDFTDEELVDALRELKNDQVEPIRADGAEMIADAICSGVRYNHKAMASQL